MIKPIRPMLATLVPKPFHRPGWVYEEKYDGIRALAYRRGRSVRLYSRNLKDITAEPRGAGITWVRPKLVAQISFAEWTADGKLRQPVFLGLRHDKKPSECTWSAREL